MVSCDADVARASQLQHSVQDVDSNCHFGRLTLVGLRAQRNIELMWLTGRLAPDFKTIADFRKDSGAAIRAVCSQFVGLCRD